MRLILNSVLLSNKMYRGHMCTGKYSLINVETIVCADLSKGMFLAIQLDDLL